MAIIAAAAAGVVLGDVAKDLVFNYSKLQYIKKIEELAALIERLNKHLTALENLRAEVSSFWNDAGSSVAIANLDKTIAATKLKTESAKALMETFKTTVDDMDKSQSGLDKALDIAKTILGVLTA